MRPILLSELDVAARALLAAEGPDRPERMAQILWSAGQGERFLARTGRYHPDHGNGSLSSAARRHGIAPARAICDSEYLAALTCVLNALADGCGNRDGPAT